MTFTSQKSYGEHTMDAFNQLINFMKDICKQSRFKELHLPNEEDYSLDENSVFFDLGSGMGKPCMHVAYRLGCKSYGLEME
jgi:hypothetical protein